MTRRQGCSPYEEAWDGYSRTWPEHHPGLRHLGDEWTGQGAGAAKSLEEYCRLIETRFITPWIAHDHTVLEIGVGGGRTAALLAARCDRLICADVSTEMLERTRARSLNPPAGIDFVKHDRMLGGGGDDRYRVNELGDDVFELADDGIDTVEAGLDWTLGDNLEALVLIGAARRGTGNTLGNSLAGTAGDDSLDGGIGADTMAGGSGDDTYAVDDVGDQVVEAADGGVDTVHTTLGSLALGVFVEAMTFIGTGTFKGTGNALDNAITGGAGTDTLNGGSGNDTLAGGAGNDSLTGNAGTDRFVVDAGTDTVRDLGGADELVVAAGATASARLAATWLATAASSNDGVAKLAASGFSADLSAVGGSHGWSVNNAGQAATVSLVGSAFGDSLNGGNGADSLTGGGGNDQLTGGAGADRFVVDAGTDTVKDLGLGGADLLLLSAGASANATLAAFWTAGVGSGNAGVAKVTANGFGVDLGAAVGPNGWWVSNLGKVAAVSLTGSVANDTLVGGNGADSLTGGGGNDQLTGGGGADRFVVDAGTDTLRDFGGSDEVQVLAGASAEASLVAAWTAGTASSNDGIARLFASGFSVDLALASGTHGWMVSNNGKSAAVSLVGSAADDTLGGGTAGDTLTGGMGTDRLTGGTGADVFRFLSAAESPSGPGRDTITDFKAADGDILDLATIDADSLLGGEQAFAWIGGAAFSHQAGELRFTAGRLQGDVNGDALADFDVTLSGVAVLDVSAIWL